MRRRAFIGGAAGATAIAAASSFPSPAIAQGKQAQGKQAQGKQEWRMVTAWPLKFPGLGTAAERLAQRITDMSDGRLTIKVYSAGELVPALESFGAVQRGAAEMSHGAARFWQERSKAFNFFTGVPFGMTSTETSTWMRYLGGQELWDKAYGAFGVKGFLSGQAGVQAGGWFRKEIETLDDLKGLKFRTSGLGGDVWRKLGVTTVDLSGGEIFQALQSGDIDAAEFGGPLTDLALGFHQVAKNYYWPSFNEPSLATELAVNKEKYDALPKDLQHIIEIACQADVEQTYAEFNARNAEALKTLVNKHGVQIRSFPRETLIAAGTAAGQVITELRDSGDDITKEVIKSYLAARKRLLGWNKITDQAYYNARLLPFRYAD